MLESNFFTKFLQLSDIRTVGFILLLVALFKVINVLQKKKVSFSTRMITGTLIGLVLGVIVQGVAKFPENANFIVSPLAFGKEPCYNMFELRTIGQYSSVFYIVRHNDFEPDFSIGGACR